MELSPHRTRRFALGVAVLLSLVNLFLHKPISDVCDGLVEWYGYATFNRYALVVLATASAVRVAAGLRARSVADWRHVLLALGATLLAYRALVIANVELVHFPQYALLAGAWRLTGLSSASAFVLATLAGAGDELYQHLVIYRGRAGTYMDYNDIVLNAIGALWGTLLVRADAATSARLRRHVTMGLLAAAVLSAITLGLPKPPYLRYAATGVQYRVLEPTETFLAVGILWLGVP